MTASEILDSDWAPHKKIESLLTDDALTFAQRQEFCNRTADRAVRNHCLTCGIPEVETWATKWLSGENRKEKAAHVAAHAAQGIADDAENFMEYTTDAVTLAALGTTRATAYAASAAARVATWTAYAVWMSCVADETAHNAARGAICAATWTNTEDIERTAQIADIRDIMK